MVPLLIYLVETGSTGTHVFLGNKVFIQQIWTQTAMDEYLGVFETRTVPVLGSQGKPRGNQRLFCWGGEGWFPPKKQVSPIDVLQTHQTGILRNGPMGSVKEPLRRMPDCLHLLLMSESEPRRCKSLKILGRSRAHDVRIKDET